MTGAKELLLTHGFYYKGKKTCCGGGEVYRKGEYQATITAHNIDITKKTPHGTKRVGNYNLTTLTGAIEKLFT